MGFGILFIGYFLTFGATFYSLHPISAAGCIIAAVGLWKLTSYRREFKRALYPCGILSLLHVASAVMGFMGYGTPAEGESALIGEQVYTWLGYGQLMAEGVLFVFTLLAVIKLAEDVELIEIKRGALKNIIVYGIYILLWLIFFPLANRIYEISPVVFSTTYAFLNLLAIIRFVMILWLLFKCFNGIIPEDRAAAEADAEDTAPPVPGFLTTIVNTFKNLIVKATTPRELRELYDRKDDGEDDSEDDDTEE